VAAAALSVAVAVVLSACSISTSERPAVTPFNPLDPSGAASASGSGGPALPDLQLRTVVSAERASAGQCPADPGPTPPAAQRATLCSADLAYVLVLGPAVVDGARVTSLDAGSLGGGPTVRVFLDVQGATALANATLRMAGAPSPGNWLAIVTGGRVQSTPVVMDQIDGGIVDITGFDNVEAARRAAALIGG
jgi:preprotein translocase subunit SecD